jgi:RNA polymerase sigma factor (sigma-70 family)
MLDSWEGFLTRYRPMACAIAQSLVTRPADVEDVVQEAALALLRALRAGEPRIASPAHARNYFLRATRNLALRVHRGSGRQEPLHDEPASPEPDPALREVRRRQELLGGLLHELQGEERDLIVRRFLRRETLAQVSAQTGVAISTLHSREKALLAELRRRLERRVAAEERGS